MRKSDKKIKRKIGALAILGIFIATILLPANVSAGDDDDWDGMGTAVLYLHDNSDDVGIGTTGPDRKLDVLDTSGPQLRLTYTDGSVYTDFETTSNGDLHIRPTNARVGIMTDSPQATLQVGGINGVGAGSIDRIAILPYNNPTLWKITARDDLVNAHLDLKYGATTILTTRGDGNVGIGTTSPQNKLDVEGGAVIGATYSGTNTAPTNGLLVEGNVGIGVTSPSASLHVDQSSTTGAKPVLTVDQADVSEEFIRFIGTSADTVLTQSIVENADVTTATLEGWLKVYVQDDGNQLTDQAYFVPIYTLT